MHKIKLKKGALAGLVVLAALVIGLIFFLNRPKNVDEAETAAPEIPAAPEPEMHAAESIPFNNKEEAPADRFTPTRRLTLTEMLDQAKATGEQPMIVQDDESGVTVLDYSDLL